MSQPSPGDRMGIRLFTLAEANALVPEVTPVLVSIRGAKQQLDAANATLARLTPAMRGNGHGSEAIALERQIAELVAQITAGLKTIAGLGIALKDLDQGLIDFPSVRDGRIVYLCWRLGEGEIAFWHEVDAGFAGREPI